MGGRQAISPGSRSHLYGRSISLSATVAICATSHTDLNGVRAGGDLYGRAAGGELVVWEAGGELVVWETVTWWCVVQRLEIDRGL